MMDRLLIAAGLLVVLVILFALRLMRSTRTAVLGNRLTAAAVVFIIGITAYRLELFRNVEILTIVALGGIVGIGLANRVRIIQMPQFIALFNGLGGAAAATIAGVAIVPHSSPWSGYYTLVPIIALLTGAVTLSGSIVATLKLQGVGGTVSSGATARLMTPAVALLIAFVVIVAATMVSVSWVRLAAVLIVGLAYGFALVSRVGAGDMPVVISFLNALSGTAGAMTGLVAGNLVLAVTGVLIALGGLNLTRAMCTALNRNLFTVLSGLGNFRNFETRENAAVSPGYSDGAQSKRDLGEMLQNAQTVIVVPGYGLALAQAQAQVALLIQALERQGKTVKVAIHPVAGRMPGHMHVLLAEAGVHHERLSDMAIINRRFPETDLVIVVGACDIVNPEANSMADTPISGMPVLAVQEARNVIVCNLDARPGYSGVQNSLYYSQHVVTCWGDAKDSLCRILQLLDGESST